MRRLSAGAQSGVAGIIDALGDAAHDASSEQADPKELAVVWVQKARKGSVQWLDECSQAQMRLYRRRKRMKLFVRLMMFVYLTLAFFEQPSWCIGDAVPCGDTMASLRSSGMPYLPFHASNAVEFACLLTFVAQRWLRCRSLGPANRGGRWIAFGHVVLSLATVDCVVAFFYIRGLVFWSSFMVARLCRPLLFLAMNKGLRQSVARVVRSIPRFFSVLASLAICLFLFVWLGIILFAKTDEGAVFESWQAAMGNMWILYTTANNPDVWVSGYNQSRWVFFFFCIYLVLTLYLLNNILLAAVYDAYKEELVGSITTFYANRKVAVEHAFRLLTGGGEVVTKDQWTQFFTLYCSPRHGGVGTSSAFNIERSNLVFQALDDDGSGGIDMDEFKLIVDVIHDADMFIPRERVPERAMGPCLRSLSRVLERGFRFGRRKYSWDTLVDGVIIVDLALTLVQTFIFMDKAEEGGQFNNVIWGRHRPWYWITLAFVIFYATETTFNIYVVGFERFWNRRPFQHRMDFFTVYALLALEVVFIFLPAPPDIIVRISVLLHISRAFRVLYMVKPLRHLATIMMRLAPTYWRLFMTLAIVFYIYATIGEQIFGGLIRTRGPLAEKIKDTAFAAGQYYALNFNDFFSGIVLLFVTMVVNNWFLAADAFSVVTNSVLSYAFFVSFFIVVNLIILNILMSLILECFASLRTGLEEEWQEQRRASVQTESWDDSPQLSPSSRRFDREYVLRRLFQDLDADAEAEERARERLYTRTATLHGARLS